MSTWKGGAKHESVTASSKIIKVEASRSKSVKHVAWKGCAQVAVLHLIAANHRLQHPKELPQPALSVRHPRRRQQPLLSEVLHLVEVVLELVAADGEVVVGLCPEDIAQMIGGATQPKSQRQSCGVPWPSRRARGPRRRRAASRPSAAASDPSPCSSERGAAPGRSGPRSPSGRRAGRGRCRLSTTISLGS